jgi:raffinose/stachyose/melibiose transport system permease protein
MFTAIMLSQKMHGWKLFRTVYFLPQVISGVALATMWAAVYNASYGLLDGLLKVMGLGAFQRNWLGDLTTAFPACLLYWVPYIGYYMVIMLADIQSIPADYYEAASLDGAGAVRQAFAITIPLIRGSLVTCMTLAMIFGLRQFEQIYMLTNGGPANRTMVMVLYLYNEMKALNYGPSSAASMVLIGIGTIVIVTLRKTVGRQES